MGLLPGFLDREEFAPLSHYLAGDRDGLKRFQLAERIADTFDQYTLFRPEMLLEWEEEKRMEESGRRSSGGSLPHPAKGSTAGGSRRISASGWSKARLAAAGFRRGSRYSASPICRSTTWRSWRRRRGSSEVNLFLLSPTREYWADIVSEREKARRTPEERALLIEGNPLLASLGKLGRDFSDTVVEIGEVAAAQQDLYGEPAGTSLLAGIQSDILNLLGAGEGREKRSLDPADRSVQIHSCHSPMREVEVLYDNLLALLERHRRVDTA